MKKNGLFWLFGVVAMALCGSFFCACSSDEEPEEEGIIEWEGERYKVEKDTLVREDMIGVTGEVKDFEARIECDKSGDYYMTSFNRHEIVPEFYLLPEFVFTNVTDEEYERYKGKTLLLSGTYIYDYSIVNNVIYLGSRLSFIPGFDYYKMTLTDIKEK